MPLDVIDGGGQPQTLRTSTSGSDLVPHHNVDTLPSAFTTDTTAIKTAVQALAALISGSRLAVELNSTLTGYLAWLATLGGTVTSSRIAVNVDSTTTGKLDSIITALGSYLSTLAGTVSASRVAVDLTSTVTGYLSTLAGAVTSNRVAVNVDSTTTGKLDTLHTDLGTTLHADLSPASTVYDGNKNVTTAGTRVALAASQALTKGVRVRAKDANTGLIYVGGSSVSSSSDRLAAGESTWMDINNLANVYIDSAVNGEGVTFSAW